MIAGGEAKARDIGHPMNVAIVPWSRPQFRRSEAIRWKPIMRRLRHVMHCGGAVIAAAWSGVNAFPEFRWFKYRELAPRVRVANGPSMASPRAEVSRRLH